MNRLFWQTVKVAPLLFAASLITGNGVNAQTISAEKEEVNQTLERINNYQQSGQNSESQVTNVNQLRDVSPTDWAYEALRSLVDRYGCISGFPNQTYRGNQPLTRYEFAAGLNSCLNQIERLIASQGGEDVESLDTIKRLTQEFEAELATIGGRVDEIESRTALLEDNQFSTTTKLKGEAIFSVSDAFGGGLSASALAENALGIDDATDEQVQAFVGDANADGVVDGDDVDAFEEDGELDDQAAFSNRIRLNFDSSFFGEDRLRARLEAGNVTAYDDDLTGTNSTRLGYDFSNDNDIELTDLWYRFPATERITAYVGTNGLDLDDVFSVSNPMLESSGTGALSRFNRRDPVLFRGTEGAGAGLTLDLIEDKLAVTGLYLTDDAALSDEGEGLFNGSNSAGAQIEFSPIEALKLTASYVRNYQTADSVNQAGSTVGTDGQGFAQNPFVNTDGLTGVTANKIGGGINVNVGERIVLAGFGGYADVEGLVAGDNPSGEIWTWGANVSFLDIGKEGAALSLAGGMVPKFISDIGDAEVAANIQEDPDTSYLVEALYKFPLNDNILITPGAYAVFNPNHVTENDTVYVGVLRTTFEF